MPTDPSPLPPSDAPAPGAARTGDGALDAELVVVGAGLAGLSLAAALADRPGLGRVLLLDPRDAWENDRTWCYWAGPGDPDAALAARSWERWAVAGPGPTVEREAPGLRYVELPADQVYAARLARVDAAAHLRRERAAVYTLRDEGDHVALETSAGPLRAGLVVDTRPPSLTGPPPPGAVRLLQHFLGWQVRVPSPRFTPGVVTLMDFDTPQEDAQVSFRYVLPHSPTEALVEDTWFGDQPVAAERYRARLRAWLGPDVEVLREERGVLPMSSEALPDHPSPRVYRLGLAGGAARPATGYAFVAIRRQVGALVRRLEAGAALHEGPLPSLRGARLRWLDAVFLRWLQARPELGPAAFHRLFERVPPAALVRFLSDDAGLFDELRVVGALAPLAGSRILDAVRAEVAARRLLAGPAAPPRGPGAAP